MLLSTYIILIRAAVVLVLVAVLVLYWLRGRVQRSGGSLWMFVPYYGRIWAERKARKQLESAEAGKVYNDVGDDDPDGKKFQKFLRDLPVYCIEESLVARLMRGLMQTVGVRYVQVVFIDKSEPKDKYAWVRKEGLTFVHDKGTYAYPCSSVKDVVYYDIIDFRPLIDMTDEIDWRNQDMCADVVTGLTNTKSMRDIRTDKLAELTTYVKYAIGGIAIIGIGLLVIYSKNSDSFKQIVQLLLEIKSKV